MKILLLTDRMEAGGAETHIAQLARGLRRMGVQVSLLSGGGALADEMEREGMEQIRVPLPTHSLARLYALRRRVRRMVKEQKFDVVHAHTRICALLIRGCEDLGAAEIVTVHAHFYANAFLSRLCYWGKFTIAVSEDLRAYACDTYHIPPERIRVISNGIDCARFSPPAPTLPHAPRILFASRLDADCNLGAELLCRLAPSLCLRFPGVRMEIAGGGSEYERIRALAEEVNRSLACTAITLLGWVEDMPALLQRQDIFVGVSRAAMEAAACGCAVILCGNEGYLGILDRNSMRDAMLTNFCGRGSRMPEEHALEADLCTLLESPSLRRSCGETGVELIRNHFGADAMCREALALYHRARPAKGKITLTVGGYFGCGNMGDDAILLGLLEELHTVAPDIDLIALSGDPRRDSRRFGIPCVGRKNPFAILWALMRSDAFLCGGGSLLQNITSGRSLSYYLFLLRLAHLSGCPALFCAAGIGPLVGTHAPRRVARALSQCPYISLRDAESLRCLRALGLDAGRLHAGADSALLMPLAPGGRAFSIFRTYGIPTDKRYLAVILRGGRETELTRGILRGAVRLICRRHNLFPLFLIFDRCHDVSVTYEAQADLGGRIVPCREPADAAAVISRSEAVLTMRLHGLILSAAVGTPALGVPGDPRDNKVVAFAKAAGEDYVETERLNTVSVTDKLEALLRDRASRRYILAASSAELRKKARKDLANITEMLYNK